MLSEKKQFKNCKPLGVHQVNMYEGGQDLEENTRRKVAGTMLS